MNGMRIIKGVVSDLYELFWHEETYSNYLKLDPNDEYTKQADHERRFRAWILMSQLTNELYSMGLFDDDDRLKIVGMLDDVIVIKANSTQSKN